MSIFNYLMKSRFERMLVLVFAVALSVSVAGTVASSVSTAFEKVHQALAVATH